MQSLSKTQPLMNVSRTSRNSCGPGSMEAAMSGPSVALSSDRPFRFQSRSRRFGTGHAKLPAHPPIRCDASLGSSPRLRDLVPHVGRGKVATHYVEQRGQSRIGRGQVRHFLPIGKTEGHAPQRTPSELGRPLLVRSGGSPRPPGVRRAAAMSRREVTERNRKKPIGRKPRIAPIKLIG
jgi:hypothetical protein